MSSKKTILLQQGEAFAHSLAGKYAKDVVVDGSWKDTKTGRIVTFTPERRARLMQETNRFLSNGNKIPFPDGHTWDATKNQGYWPGPFVNLGTRLIGVVEPRGDDIKQKIKDRKIDAVSVVIEYDHEDPKGNIYPEVITQICATPVPVLTDQKDFVELSQVEGLEEILVAEPAEETEPALEFLEGPAPSFEELARAFERPPAPSFEALAQGFGAMVPAPPPPSPPAPPPIKLDQGTPAASPVTVNVTISEGAFKADVKPAPVTINQGDVNVSAEIKPTARKIELKKKADGSVVGESAPVGE